MLYHIDQMSMFQSDVSVVEADSVVSFINAVQNLEQRHIAQWFYRGHYDCTFQLVPSIFRLDTDGAFATWMEIERYMMNRFKCEATPYINQLPVNGLEWLALAQHHGLPTRLLDWSLNPLVGLYFAVERDMDANADVWCLGFPSTNNCLPESTYLARRKTLDQMDVIYYPKHLSPRMTNQSGCFTVHDSPTPLNCVPDTLWVFTCIKILAKFKVRLLNELYELGVHKGSIYPGLDGLAQRISYEVSTKHARHTIVEDPLEIV